MRRMILSMNFGLCGVASLVVLTSLGSASAQVQQAWVQVESGGVNRAAALALDTNANVYVTGSSITVKYSSNGTRLWSATNSDTTPVALAVDTTGNSFITGASSLSGTQLVTIVKFSPGGQKLWVARYRDPADRYGDEASALAVDSVGNVYVIAYDLPGSSGFLTLKYDTNGHLLWHERYPGRYTAALAVDSAGNAYVTGQSAGGFATVKYNAAGNQIWAAHYADNCNNIQPHALAVDGVGNVFVTSASRCGPDEYLTVKYDPAGNQLWAARYRAPTLGDSRPSALAVDNAGNAYVTGVSDPYSASLTIKYDPDGNSLWVARYLGAAYAIALDNFGNAYVTGGATVKYSPTGNQLWVTPYNAITNQIEAAFALALDSAANVYVTGTASPNVCCDASYETVKYVQSAGADFPVIVTPPQSQAVLAGTTLLLATTVTSQTPLTYQWRFNGANLAGETGQTLQRTNIQLNQAGEYSVVVSNSSSWSVSPEARVIVNAAPTINLQPQSQTVFAGESVSFLVDVEGYPDPAFQWQLNGTNLDGQTGLGLGIYPTTPADAGDYTFIASNSFGSVTSLVATLTVIVQAPVITVQPSNQTALAGEFVALSVVAAGHPSPQFQWRLNDIDIPGAMAGDLDLNNVGTNQAGRYTVVVSNYVGAITSSVATLTILLEGIILDQQPVSQTAVLGHNAAFFVALRALPPPSYQWLFNGSPLEIATNLSLNLTNVSLNDAGGYSVIISNSAMTITSQVAMLTVTYPGPLDIWTERPAPADTGMLRSIIYANGLFVTVGDHGVILTSSDGANWSNQISGTSLDLAAITWGNGLFVAGGNVDFDSVILTSSNGLNWSSQTFPGYAYGFTSAAYGNGLFVLAGYNVLLTSPDGFDWSSGTLPDSLSLTSVAYGKGQFIAIGFNFEGYNIVLSPDATNWNGYFDLPLLLLNGVGVSAGEFLVVGGNFPAAAALRSETGDVWTEEDLPISGYLNAACYADGTFVAVGEDGVIASSSAAGFWKIRRSEPSQKLTAVAYGRGTFVAVGDRILQSGYTPSTLSGERLSDGAFKLSVSGGIDANNYYFQAASDLGTADWLDLFTFWPTYSNSEFHIEFIDHSAANLSRRFYRTISR